MRPDHFQARMKSICTNPDDDAVRRDAVILLVSAMAEHMPGFGEGLRVFQNRIHEPRLAVKKTGEAR